MLYLLDKDVKTVKWNGIPLHEASSAIVKEEVNGDFTLTIRYPITDSGIYQLIKEDMLIKAPVPVLGAQLFRIKKPIENDDSLDITAYHISDDVMQRSINPMSVIRQGCFTALSQMVQNAKTGLGSFSFTSDIADNHTFTTDKAETLYTVLMDGKHSIVGTWEGELVRDNFALTVKRSRGADRGVVITTHKNLKSYQRTKNSQSVVTRIHAKSTFKAEGAEEETTINVTVDSPLIGNYPYINEKDYENNNAKTVDELRKWAEAKFKNEGIDKISDAIEIEAYELDGQVIHLGDTVNIKSRKHDVDLYKKAIAYEYNALTEEYISITFDDKPGVGGSGVSSGVSNAADVILSANKTAQEVAIERAIRNANQAFDAEFEKRVEKINDGIEQSKAEAERYADTIKQEIATEINDLDTAMQAQAQEHDRQVADILTRTGANADLANVAKQLAERAQADLATIRTNLTGLIAQTNTKAGQLEQSITSVRADVASQARSILAQAQAQTALTNRVTTVETLADGTRLTVAELSKTVSQATGDIASVSSRTKTVEDGLVGVNTRYTETTIKIHAQTGQITTLNAKTAQLESGLNGVKEKFENIKIGSRNYFSQYLANYDTSGVYAIRLVSETQPITITVTDKDTSVDVSGCYFGLFKDKFAKQGALWLLSNGTLYNAKKTISGWPILAVYPKNQATLDKIFSRYKVMVEIGNIATDWVPAEEDFRHELATYVRNAEEDSAELSRRIETVDGKAVDAKTYAQQTATAINTRLESLETYKNAEGTRASQYFTASRDETARQVSALRVAVTQDYVAKSVFEETARGISRRFESLYVGGTNLLTGTDEYTEIFNSEQSHAEFLRTPYDLAPVFDKYGLIEYTLSFDLRASQAGQVVVYQQNGSGSKYSGLWKNLTVTTEWQRFHVTFTPTEGTMSLANSYLAFYGTYGTGVKPIIRRVKIERGAIATDWSLALEDQLSYADTKIAEYKTTVDGRFATLQSQKANQVDLQTVRETVNLYERIIGSTETGIKDKVARMVMTDSLFLTEVKDKISGTATQVSQLNNSYAIKNLTSAGTVLNQINLLANGTNRIDGRLTHITGQTLIDNGVIKNAMIGELDAGKITSGTVDAARIKANSIDGSKIAFDEAFFNGLSANQAYLKKLFAKDAFLTAVQAVNLSAKQIAGGIAKALNGGMDVNFDESKINFYTNVAAIRRIYT
ncbi:TPA: phage tail protein, partial [Streptococcus suis]|nr:phage tail protein [Streptococcus suis]